MADDLTHDPADDDTERRRFHPGQWIGWILAAVFLAAAIALAHHVAWMRGQITLAQGQAARLQMQLDHANEVVNVLTSPDAKHVVLTELREAARPSGQVSWLESDGALAFVASGLKPLGAGRSYELWLVPAEGKAPIPAGLFRPGKDGTATVLLPALPAHTAATKFLVTEEPAEGSPTPSLPLVMQGED